MSTRVAYGVVLLVVACTTAVCTPLFRRLAIRIGAVVAPDERRVHERPTPLLGGAAMLVGLLAGVVVAWRLDALSAVFFETTELWGVVIAATLMLAIGTLDDLREVSAPAKVAGIVLCASVMVRFGVSMLVFRLPFAGVIVLSPDWSYLLSVVWVLGMTNAINLIDGLDGLAAGIVAIASGTFFLYTMLLTRDGVLLDSSIAPLVSVIVLGMCVGFLPFNFHPARIFMGDGGALLLGLLMAASTMVVGGRTGEEVQFSGQTYFFFAPLLIPLVILGVPIVDTLLAIVRRARKRSGVASADKEHIHHRLMRLGHGQRRSVLILWGWTLLLSVMVLYPAYAARRGEFFVPIGIVALGLALYTVLHPGARTSRAERRAEKADDARAAGPTSATDDATTGSADVPGPPPAPTGGAGGAAGEAGRPVASIDLEGLRAAVAVDERAAGAADEPSEASRPEADEPATPAPAPGRVTPEEALASLDAQLPTVPPPPGGPARPG